MSGANCWRFRWFRWLSLVVLAASAMPASCGGNPQLSLTDEPFESGAELGDPCSTNDECSAALLCGPDGVCIGACGEPNSDGCGEEACLPSGRCSEGRGHTCQGDDDCNDGLVCSSLGRCAVPCETGETEVCKAGDDCRDDGTCPTDDDVVLDGIGGAGNGPEPGGMGGAASCIDVKVSFEPQVPTVLLLIDRSASMNANNFGQAVADAVAAGTYTLGDCPSNNDWRWNVVRDVLFNVDKGIVKPLEDQVRFGLSLYSSQNGLRDDNANIDNSKMCPVLVEVPIALGNHQAMLDQFQCSSLVDDTPTGESLLAAAATLQAFDEPGPKIIVLATDGEPDNCECPDFTDDDWVPAECRVVGVPDQIKADVVATAEQIHADDIQIHVINVSTPGNAGLQQHLEDVAIAGGGQVYQGFSPGALSTAFEAIINGVRSCVIDLDGEIAEGKESTGTVTLDGDELLLDDENGWQVNTPSQIELLGTACEAIKSGDHDLDISFPCESFDPIVH